MNEPTQPEARYELVLTYLLDQLPQADTAALDSDMLTSDDSLAQFEEAVADALDAYADGTLSPANRKRVEELVATRPAMARRVQFAQDLRAIRDRAATRRKSPWMVGNHLRWMGAIAAVLLIMVFAWKSARRSETTDVTVVKDPTTATKAPPAFTIILSPTVLRGAKEDAVSVPVEARSIRLQALLPSGSSVTVATARITNNSGATVRQFDHIATQTIERDRYIEVTLQATDLPAGTYTISLFDASNTPVAHYRLTRLP